MPKAQREREARGGEGGEERFFSSAASLIAVVEPSAWYEHLMTAKMKETKTCGKSNSIVKKKRPNLYFLEAFFILFDDIFILGPKNFGDTHPALLLT